VVALILRTSVARATQPVPDEAAEKNEATSSDSADPAVRSAREAFVRGAALARQGRWSEALEAFEQSYALRKHPITSYNLGYCERAVGHYTRAHKMLNRALREHASGELGILPEHLVQLAHHYLAEADSRMARVEATLSPPDARVLVDGRPLEQELEVALESRAPSEVTLLAGTRDPAPGETLPGPTFSLLLDPGTHIIVVSGTGGPDSLTTARFEAGQLTSLTLVLSRDPSRRDLPSAPPKPWIDRRWGYVALGVGAAGFVVGGVFTAMAMHERSVLDQACGAARLCTPSMSPDIDAYKRDAVFGTTALSIGVAGVGVGIATLLLVHDPSAASKAARVVPVVGWGSIGVAGRL
jgi:hypothetical protein